MRFGIRDLLSVTAIVSIYAAVSGVFVSRGGFSGNPLSALGESGPHVWWMLFFAWQLLHRYSHWLLIRRESHEGVVAIEFPKPFWRHAVILAAFLVLSLPRLMTAKPELPWGLVPLFLFLHAMNERTRRVRFTNKGIITDNEMIAWDDYQITLKEGNSPKLVCWRKPNDERLAPTIVELPPDCEDEVRTILAKQASRQLK